MHLGWRSEMVGLSGLWRNVTRWLKLVIGFSFFLSYISVPEPQQTLLWPFSAEIFFWLLRADPPAIMIAVYCRFWQDRPSVKYLQRRL
jgi:hypothetical protein